MDYTKFSSAQTVVEKIALEFKQLSQQNRVVHISLSGGSTPKLLLKTLAQEPFKSEINWQNLHFWWGDERMVSAESLESNFGEAKRILFDHIQIPAENLHPLIGSNEINHECQRMQNQIQELIPNCQFDWIILGVGDDGHTASLFPNHTNYADENLCCKAQHPVNGQWRISATAKLLSQAHRITFLVTGASKAQIIGEIFNQTPQASNYPAFNIRSHHGITQWWIDQEAGAKI